MISLLNPDLSAYIEDHADPESELLSRLRQETLATLPMPQMQVGRVEGAFLRMLVALLRPRRILEIGTYSGYSALAMAGALQDDGELITCDVDEAVTKVARRYFDESGYGDRIKLRIGPALQTIAELAREQAKFDLVFIDADKENYSNYFDAVMPLINPNGLIVADNTLWSGKVLAPQEKSDHAIVAFNKKIAEDPRVERVLLSVRDGMILARKL